MCGVFCLFVFVIIFLRAGQRRMWSLAIRWKPVCFLLSWSERAPLECARTGNVLQASQPEISGCDLFLRGDK